jgi:hypothetical protein
MINGAHSSTRGGSSSQSVSGSGQQKIMITGDDILIEYVTRLMKALSSPKVKEEDLSPEQANKIEKFITHYVWYSGDKKE